MFSGVRENESWQRGDGKFERGGAHTSPSRIIAPKVCGHRLMTEILPIYARVFHPHECWSCELNELGDAERTGAHESGE